MAQDVFGGRTTTELEAPDGYMPDLAQARRSSAENLMVILSCTKVINVYFTILIDVIVSESS